MSYERDSEEEAAKPQRERIHPRSFVWDGTINAGNLISVASMVVLIFVQWNMMDKRVTILERDMQYQTQRDQRQDDQLRDAVLQLQSAVKDLTKTVEQLREQQRPRLGG
jgi:hypothetical protein